MGAVKNILMPKVKKDKQAEAALAAQQAEESKRLSEEKTELSEHKTRSKNPMGGLLKTGQAGITTAKKTKLSGIV